MTESHKLDSFEGLRGIASFVVVLHHLRLAFFPSLSNEIRDTLKGYPVIFAYPIRAIVEAPLNGSFAVWLFWIMSGFVLSLQFFRRSNQLQSELAHDYLENAFLRRYPRLLLPVLFSVLFAYLLHAAGFMFNSELARVVGDLGKTTWLAKWYTFPASWTGAVNSAVWEAFFHYDSSTSYNNVLWTMQAEFYGSLFLFSFLAILGHRRSRFLIYFIAAFAIHFLGLDWLNAFVVGIAASDIYVNGRKIRSIAFLSDKIATVSLGSSLVRAVLLWTLVLLGAGMANYSGIVYLVAGSLAVYLALVSTVTQSILASRVPMFLGRISFGLYLIHIPIICSFSCWFCLVCLPILGYLYSALVSSVLTCALSLFAGYISYVLADRPGIQFSRWLSGMIVGTVRK